MEYTDNFKAAVHEIAHAFVGHHLRGVLVWTTIDSPGRGRAMVLRLDRNDEAAMILAGFASEMIFFDKCYHADIEGDLHQLKAITAKMSRQQADDFITANLSLAHLLLSRDEDVVRSAARALLKCHFLSADALLKLFGPPKNIDPTKVGRPYLPLPPYDFAYIINSCCKPTVAPTK